MSEPNKDEISSKVNDASHNLEAENNNENGKNIYLFRKRR
jgi:hypothetical protein